MGVGVDVEPRDTHEQGKGRGARKDNWEMVAKKATTMVSVLRRPTRRWRGVA